MRSIIIILLSIAATVLIGLYALCRWFGDMFLFNVAAAGIGIVIAVTALVYLVIYLMSRKTGAICLITFTVIADIVTFMYNSEYGIYLLLAELAVILLILVSGLGATLAGWLSRK